jgi:hypothetical protein
MKRLIAACLTTFMVSNAFTTVGFAAKGDEVTDDMQKTITL